ncbi:MAG: ATP-binding cassette domain-containing protein [Ruminococcaceae bacterium]|nr:ATP-binding cassette domain-containing protein [Oscillospiraceae bacterium]
MIKIQHLTKNYGTNCAVDDISCEIGRGETVGFLGPNGAGKSTTMNILTGYLSASAGRVLIDGIDILSDPIGAKKLIGYLPEQPPVYFDMTVDEYLNFNYDLKGCTFDRKAHLNEICEVTRIGDVRRRLIKNLSKGYRQRVGVAQALIGNPPVIIFDEPTVGLDPKQIIEMRSLIRTLGKKHTVLISTHILQEVQAVCDRIVIINKGKIVADEKTENITRAVESNKRYSLKVCGNQREVLDALKSVPGICLAEAQTSKDGDAQTYIIECESGADVRKKLFFTLAQRNLAMIGLEAVGMNLEDVFISVVEQTEQAKAAEKTRYARNTTKKRELKTRETLTKELAEDLIKNAEEQRARSDDEDN